MVFYQNWHASEQIAFNYCDFFYKESYVSFSLPPECYYMCVYLCLCMFIRLLYISGLSLILGIFPFLFLKYKCVFLSFSPHTSHLKFIEIIASDSVMTSLKCHTLVFASNCLFIPPSELTGHTLAYAFVYNDDFQFIEWSHHLNHYKNTRIKAVSTSCLSLNWERHDN